MNTAVYQALLAVKIHVLVLGLTLSILVGGYQSFGRPCSWLPWRWRQYVLSKCY